MSKPQGDSDEVTSLVAVFTDAVEDAQAERLPVLAALTETDKMWAAIAHPLGGRDVERRAVAAIEGSQILKPLLDHGAAGGILTIGRGGTNITAHNLASGLVADSLRESLLIEADAARPDAEAAVGKPSFSTDSRPRNRDDGRSDSGGTRVCAVMDAKGSERSTVCAR